MNEKKLALAFKYCGKGCGKDYYYGYSVEQTVGTIYTNKLLSDVPLILFEAPEDLLRKTESFEKIFVCYLFRTANRREVFSDLLTIGKTKSFTKIASGAHPCGDPWGTLGLFDFVIVGDAEVAFKDLIKELILEKKIDVSGVWYKDEKGNIREGGHTPPVDLNTIPPFSVKHTLFAPIEITRGCPFACRFCCVSYIYGVKPRHRKISEIEKWVKVLVDHKVRVINFLTPNAFSYGSEDGRKINKEAIKELLERLSKVRKGSKIIFGNYLSNIRPDFVREDLLGFVRKYTQTPTIHMGAQSGSNRVLRLMNTGYDVKRVEKAAILVRRFGFNCSMDFIFGLPGEFEEDRQKTINFIKKLIKIGVRPRIHAFMPLPGTPLENEQRGKLSSLERREIKKLASRYKMTLPFEYEEIC